MQVGFIHSTSNENQEILISVKEFFFKEENNELIISENGGSIKVQVDDDCLVLKLIQKIQDAKLQETPLQEGSTYFMEVGERLSYKNSEFKLKTLSHAQQPDEFEVACENDELNLDLDEDLDEDQSFHHQENQESLEEIKLATQDDSSLFETTSSDMLAKDESDDDTDNGDEDISFIIDTDDNGPIQAPMKDNTDSLSITQVLNVARLQNAETEQDKKTKKNKKKSNKNTKKKKSSKSKDASHLKLGTARDYEGAKIRKAQQKKKKTKRDENKLVGPFTRFMSALSLVFAATIISTQVEVDVINSLSVKLADLTNTELAKYVDFLVSQDIAKIFIVLFGILFISNLLFSVSPTLFISGATTSGSFLSKRAKAVLRTPLDLIAHLIPIFELPVVFDTPSLKELITRGRITYRVKGFKFISLINLAIFILLVIGYPIIQEGFSNTKAPSQINVPKELGKRPLKIKELLLSKKFSQEHIVLRTGGPKPSYFIINKDTANTYLVKMTDSMPFKRFENSFSSIPFFKYRYPYLSSFYKDEKSSFLTREDFGKLFWAGEIIKGRSTKDLVHVDLLAIGQSKKAFSEFKMDYKQYRNLNRFTSFYRGSSDEIYLYIAQDQVMQFSKIGGNMKSSELEGFTFLARPKVKIEYIDSVEKAFQGTNKSILMSQLEEINQLVSLKDNGENRASFVKFSKDLAHFLQGSSNTVGQEAAKEILKLSTLNN
ncbi:hypothetical protein M902_3261 [Bacteriovorax sp. BAL6_X]|uniref:hypothetical protein n=1 Tax=Bacteriovorax sp. BAL6_X TaxID=1201290 RepID=UPI000385C743|nr:hypothetical protein [Bacteriovorax sp. BAL6_X]EPZ50805.1 hypothetical protein M902_3261 [Bacteriovorax sp. BAL6_X]